MVTATSAVEPTVVVCVAELLAGLASPVAEVADAVFVITVPSAAPASTCTTSVKTADAPEASDDAPHEIDPVPPDAVCHTPSPPVG